MMHLKRIKPILLPMLAISAAVPSWAADNGSASSVTATSATTVGDLNTRAATLTEQGRDALSKGDNNRAIEIYNQLLNLPPNPHSQEAQEMAGLARERNGENAKAKAEYDLYLKLYPEGEGAERVRQRLANLAPPAAASASGEKRAPRKKQEISETSVYGSFSQFYYHGASHVDTTTVTAPTITERSTLTNVDQSALISNLDLTARMRSGDYDNRIVVRDTNTYDKLDATKTSDRLTAAYFELKNKQFDYGGRFGRQPGNAGGVLGRFDGLSLNWQYAPQWRLNAIAGKPAESTLETKRQFAGVSLDMGTFAEHWNTALYLFNQTADGITDRRALGGEVRYFDANSSLYSLVDYDIYFGALNTLLVQGNWQSSAGTSYNLLLDRRKTPSLQITNALTGETTTSIKTLLETRSEAEIKQLAEMRTQDSTMLSVGLTHPWNTTWQVGGDVRMTNVSSMPASGSLPATPSTGNEFAYTLQAIGSNIFSLRDVTVLSASQLDGSTYNGQSFSVSNRTTLQEKWTLDASLRLYRQKDNLGTKLTRISPTLKVAYQWKEKISFEAEGGMEINDTESATLQEKTDRKFYSVGYRWDF